MSTAAPLQTRATRPKPPSSSARGGLLLQRKCACGSTVASLTGECAECKSRKGLQTRLIMGSSNDPLEPEADRIADRVMADSSVPAISGVPRHIQRFAAQLSALASVAPAGVDQVLASPGWPLDPVLRQEMQERFGHDFSKVRVHTDAPAAESARAANALAYTVGDHIVFGAGRYAPESLEGRKLLVHELTHTVQQTQAGGHAALLDESSAEQESERNTAELAAGTTASVEGRVEPGTMQKADDKALDETAKKIIQAAKDTSKGIEERAINAVNSIVKAYYDPALVEKVVYDDKDKGLTTTPIGKGKDIKGQITVGRTFIENIDSFARRVLQVGHELQHVQQQRLGMGGPSKKNEREFLAFHWEATQPEKAGTGKMPHATRVDLIDEALRNYYCMPDADQKSHADKKEELLKLRATEEKASGKEHKEPPKKCEK